MGAIVPWAGSMARARGVIAAQAGNRERDAVSLKRKIWTLARSVSCRTFASREACVSARFTRRFGSSGAFRRPILKAAVYAEKGIKSAGGPRRMQTEPKQPELLKVKTGVVGLDEILPGGLPA